MGWAGFLRLFHRSPFFVTLRRIMDEPIVFQVDEKGLALLLVNRPEARNALNWAAQEAFAAAVNRVSADGRIRALIISGQGEQAFAAGGDLKELCCAPETAVGQRLNQTMGGALAQLGDLPIPVIVAVNGDAFGGGCEIVTAGDLRLAAAHARFSFAQARNGLTTGWGGAARLTRLIGQSRALELLLTARLFNAAEAQQIGLIHRVVPAGQETLAAALAWAEELLALPTDALAAIKKLTRAAAHLSPEEATRLESDLFLQLWGSPNHVEALNAFREKRKATFNGAGGR